MLGELPGGRWRKGIAELVARSNGETGQDFLGCSAYPDCKHTQELPIDMQMRRQGAPELPGFG